MLRKCPDSRSPTMLANDTGSADFFLGTGTLQNFKLVTFALDCQNGDWWSLHPEPDWDDFDKATQTHEGSSPKERNGHLKRAIINAALDGNLA